MQTTVDSRLRHYRQCLRSPRDWSWEDAGRRGAVKDIVPERHEVHSLVSPTTRDRYGTRFDWQGWRLESFRKVGVVTFQHTMSSQPIGELPVARNERIWSEKDGVHAITRFGVDEPGVIGETARMLWSVTDHGYLRGWSHWFDPFGWTQRDSRKVERPMGAPFPDDFYDEEGRVYTSMDMLEYGPVIIPANPDAVTVRAFRRLVDDGLAAVAAANGGVEPEGLRRLMGGDQDLLIPVNVEELARAGFVVQTLCFPRDKWESADECRDWLRENDFKYGSMDDDGEAYRFRQRDPDDFERIRPYCLDPKDAEPNYEACRILAFGGPLKSEAQEALNTGLRLFRLTLATRRTRAQFASLHARLDALGGTRRGR